MSLSLITVYYLGAKNVTVNSVPKDEPCLLEEESISCCLSMKNPSSFGWGSSFSLVNIETTNDMLGMSFEYSCTHNNPIWIARKISKWLQYFATAPSVNSNISPLWIVSTPMELDINLSVVVEP